MGVVYDTGKNCKTCWFCIFCHIYIVFWGFFFVRVLLFLHPDVNYWLSCRLFQAMHVDGGFWEDEDED